MPIALNIKPIKYGNIRKRLTIIRACFSALEWSFKGSTLKDGMMLTGLARKFFGSHNERVLRQQDKLVMQINTLEAETAALTDDALRARTATFKERIAKGETLDDLLPEAFATVREAAKRVLGQRPFDVQLRGGIVLHQGRTAEMKPGEGKPLVATFPVYLNALSGKGVHVVTVNDSLARRDSGWMGRIYNFLGLTVGCIVHGLDDNE